MRVGVSTACFYPNLTEKTPELLERAGVKCAEVFLNSYSEYDEDFCKMLREKFDKSQIEIISVHSFVAMHEPFLFGSYERRKKDAVGVYKKVITASHILGAKFHTFHDARKEFMNDGFKDLKAFGKDMSNLADIAGGQNIKLAWENVCWCMSNSPEFLRELMPYITSDNLGFTLDLKQSDRANSNYLEYLDVFGDRLLNVHVSDKNEKYDCMLPGSGSRDFGRILADLKRYNYDGDLIIEVYNNSFKSVDEIKKSEIFLENIIKNLK